MITLVGCVTCFRSPGLGFMRGDVVRQAFVSVKIGRCSLTFAVNLKAAIGLMAAPDSPWKRCFRRRAKAWSKDCAKRAFRLATTGLADGCVRTVFRPLERGNQGDITATRSLQALRQTCWSGTSQPPRPTKNGRSISLISRPAGAGCIWPS